MIKIEDVREKVDFGIITVRTDEFEAILSHFIPFESVQGRRRYMLSTVPSEKESQYLCAIVRSPQQGYPAAQQTAEALIVDLDPAWILLVGIGGAVPDSEFTLGDVVLAARLSDFSVQAAIQGKSPEFDLRGSYAHPEVEDLLAVLPALTAQLASWTDYITVSLPTVDLAEEKFYGPPDWQEKAHRSLERHFSVSDARKRIFISGTLGSSNTLVKDADLVLLLARFARSIIAFEMEAGGVFTAARRKDREYPVLVIRGISDVVGFSRDPAWTSFACKSAAAFTFALVKSGEIKSPRGLWPDISKTAKKHKSSAPDRIVPEGFAFERAYSEETRAFMDDLSWNPDGSRLGVLMVSKFLILGPVGPEFRLEKDLAAMHNLVWSPDGRFIAAGSSGGVFIWTTEEWRQLGTVSCTTSWNTRQISWSKSMDLLASAQGDRIDLWQVGMDSFGNLTQACCRHLTGYAGDAQCLVFSPDGKTLASSHDDGAIRTWDVVSMKNTRTIQTNDKFICNLSWCCDGKSVAYRGYRLAVWESLTALRVLESSVGYTGGLSFSGDGKLLGYGVSSAVRFRSQESWEIVNEISEAGTQLEDVLQIKFADGRDTFAICGRSKIHPHNDEIQIWRVVADR